MNRLDVLLVMEEEFGLGLGLGFGVDSDDDDDDDCWLGRVGVLTDGGEDDEPKPNLELN